MFAGRGYTTTILPLSNSTKERDEQINKQKTNIELPELHQTRLSDIGGRH